MWPFVDNLDKLEVKSAQSIKEYISLFLRGSCKYGIGHVPLIYGPLYDEIYASSLL